MSLEDRPLTVPNENPAQQNGFGHLAVELFKTERYYWALDANRVEFVKIDDVAFEILHCLRKEHLSLDEIASRLPQYSRETIEETLREIFAAQQYGYFLPTDFKRRLRFKRDDYRSVLSDRMGGLTISLTTQCNLACSYCLFGGQYSRYPTLSGRTMTWAVLRNALDFLILHSRNSKRIHVLFFGGEPLIAFKLIKRAVAHLRNSLINDPRELRLSICTNGTILNELIMSFLVDNKITIQFSLDGGKEIHDQSRCFKSNRKGSFDIILKNLKTIERRFPEYFRDFVRIKSVVSSSAVEQQQAKEVENNPISDLVARENANSIIVEPHYDVSLDGDYFRQILVIGELLLKKEGVSTLDELLQDLSHHQKEFFWQSYGWFFAAQAIDRIEQRGERELPFSKGCMIGASEGHVDPDGNISICHKAQQGSAFVIGNVNDGKWDFTKIDELETWLHSFNDCSHCFAHRFCDLCFEKLKGEPGGLDTSRRRYCEFTRRSMQAIFQTMLEVMGRNPRLWAEVICYVNKRVEAARVERDKQRLH